MRRQRAGELSLLYLSQLPPSCLSHLIALPQLKKDAEFQEFLSVHQKRTQVATWANDALDSELPKSKTKPAGDYLNFDSNSDSDSDSGQESEEEPAPEEPEGKRTLLGVYSPLPAGPWPDGHQDDKLGIDIQRTLCVTLTGDEGYWKGPARCCPPAV